MTLGFSGAGVSPDHGDHCDLVLQESEMQWKNDDDVVQAAAACLCCGSSCHDGERGVVRVYDVSDCDSKISVGHRALCGSAESAGDFEIDFSSGLQAVEWI